MHQPTNHKQIHEEVRVRIMRYSKRNFNCISYSLVAAVIFITSGILLVVYRTIIYEKLKEETFKLTPDSRTFNIFKKTPFDVYYDFYFFNWTNPEEIYDPNKKPVVQEIGPFRFLEVVEKTNITFHQNSTLSFNRTRRWYFVREGSYHDLHTPITTVDPVAVSGAYALRHQNFFMRKGFSFSLNSIKGRIHLTKSVGQMLFDGYDDPLISLAKGMSFLSKSFPPFDKFGWFYTRNGSDSFDGRFNIGTGEHPSHLGEIYSWNNYKHTPYYEDFCGDVRGSAGEFLPQNLPKSPLGIFNVEICRTLFMDYVGEQTKNMFNAYKFVVGDHFLDNGTIFPENRCYCTGDCVPYGAVNVSSCRYGSPGFVSLPHFYKADPYYNSLVDGLKPSEKHDFYMLIEPITGLPLEVSARLQLNLMIKEVPSISLLKNVKDIFFPMLWFEQVVEMPNNLMLGLFFLLNVTNICLGIGIFLIAIGIVTILSVTYRIYTMKLCVKETKENIFIRELVPLNDVKLR